MTKEKMFEENQNLAYKIAEKYYAYNKNDFEDIKQVALLGLWKAILTFDDTRTLSTYAYPCISNEINYYLRQKKKNNRNISIETEIGNNITIADTLQDKTDYFGFAELKTSISENVKKLNKREKTIFAKVLKGKTQKEIATEMGISQPYVSRTYKTIKEIIKGIDQKGDKVNVR